MINYRCTEFCRIMYTHPNLTLRIGTSDYSKHEILEIPPMIDLILRNEIKDLLL